MTAGQLLSGGASDLVPEIGVSAVIPLYNKARHIRRAIDSVLAQTHQHFEIVVIDDGSTDGGGDIVRQMADPRIRLFVQPNAGVSAARNRGIHEATFENVAFLDADDEWLPCYLETVVGLRVRYPQAGIYAMAYRTCRGEVTRRLRFTDCIESPEGGLLDDYFRAALGPQPVWTSVAMIPKSVFDEVGGFTIGLKNGEDLQMWARIALRYRVAWSPVEGAVYHLSADNRAGVRDRGREVSDIAAASAIEDFLRSGGKPVSTREMLDEYLARMRLPLALQCYLHGQRTTALELLGKTRGTTRFRRKRLLIRSALYLPPELLRPALRGKKALHRPKKREEV